MTTFAELSQALTDTTKSPGAAVASSLYESWLGLSEQCVRFDKWNPYQVQGAAICGSRLK